MIRPLALALAAFSFPACATIDRGVTDHIRVDTVPQGAMASFTYIPSKADGRNPAAVRRVVCDATPCAIEIRRSQRGIVRVEKAGYQRAEYYVGPSRYRGGGGVDLNVAALKTTSTSLGVGLTGGIIYAGLSQFAAAFGNIFTFGVFNFQGVSTASGATAGTGIGIGIAAGSMLIDAGSSANENTYPNPVTIGLTQSEAEPEDDPFVSAYYRMMKTYQQQQRICKIRRRADKDGPSCSEAKLLHRDAKSDLYTLEDQRDDEIKSLMKAAKEAGAAQDEMSDE